ncbi:hypothetical protein DFH07DRAFT_968678 [Mycena maculata]|uniref:Uncharacterized protein n=1 Tax=Mycena maculata TaxID=230809 RepID=A0AAD7HZ88_9AGAR|nr:hypothetical protein DFH07DRAFT_968678 [Mycena maculata]
MPNPLGINGTAPKNPPSDDVLKEALLKYTRQGQSREDQLTSLRKDFGLSALRKEKIRLNIPTVRTQKLTVDELTQAVINEVEKDTTMSCGPDFIKDQLRLKMLASSALRMGSVGFSIYGYKDKYTDFVLLLKVYPDVRTSGAGGHIFLDFVEETGYIPIQLTTDKGSEEVGWAYAFMSVLREIYALAPVIQAELDDFVQWWNNHRVRHQHEKIMPSGHVPSHAMDYPELFGGLDCRIKIPPEAIADLREQLETEEGPKSDFQAWPGLTEEFNLCASEVYVAIGEPGIKLANTWDVFVQMAMEFMTPPINKPVLATITHLKSDCCPILEAGVITPEILYMWRRACQKYLKNCKERTADDLVSFVADEMREPILEKWYMASQTRIDALKLDAYISELGTLVLEKGWEGKMRRKVLGAKMTLGQKFADWAYDIQNVNAILSQAAPTFAVANPELKNILDAGLTATLQADLDTEPVLSTELNAWISEVKGRDDRLKFETGRMQELIDAQPARSSPKGKLSLAERLSSPKPSLASRLTAPPAKDTNLKCPPLTDAEKVLLDLHDGCRRCRKFYIGHRTLNCDGDFPDAATYRTLTQADAVAQAVARGKTLWVKREPAAVRTPKNILDADYEESDSDRDGWELDI